MHFISDEHFGHYNIIKYCNRPFKSVEEMDETIIKNHNEIVSKNDIVIHAGDFTLEKKEKAWEYVNRLNGTHIFLQGSHDYWLKGDNKHKQIWEKTIEGQHIVVCHYSMRVWPRSHYGSWQLYGHSHGNLPPLNNQYDIGVDNNNFYPVSFDKLKLLINHIKKD